MVPTSFCNVGGRDVVGQYYDDAVNTLMTNTASLAYDPTHRLTGAVATGNSTYNLAFAYDRYGNMTCQRVATVSAFLTVGFSQSQAHGQSKPD